MLNKPLLEDLKNIAITAGDIILDGYRKDIEIHQKGKLDVVTEVDHLVEKTTIQMIRTSFPGDFIVTEESGEIGEHSSGVWYLDPLDGTINYAHKIPYFSFSLGYVLNGEPTLAVVYDPLRSEMFLAEKNNGATLNDSPININQHKKLHECLLVNEYSNHPISFLPTLRDFEKLNPLVQGIRREGSCALDLCYVAAGRYDAFWSRFAFAWDFAAGSLICREAGAKVTTIDGKDDFLKAPCSTLAASPLLHSAMLQILTPNK